MTNSVTAPNAAPPGAIYDLDAQIGFLLRQAFQRHTLIFAKLLPDDLTTTQWAVVAKLNEIGDCSQNQLGRLTAMDVATIKGVVDRLVKRGTVAVMPDLADRRRRTVALTEEGRRLYARCADAANKVTAETLAPLEPVDREALVRLIKAIT